MCVTSPSPVANVLSTEGPVFPVAFLPLTQRYWPTLMSSQSHVPFSNVQPTNPELVSFTAKKKKFSTWFPEMRTMSFKFWYSGIRGSSLDSLIESLL